jgi:hypothetical protein
MKMPAEFTEMLLISSNDYWGHAGSFNSEYNFYPHTFILSQSGYAGLEEDADRSRFFPCALFYYRGETDNHGFTPSTIGVMVDGGTASVGRVQGIDRMGNRERRTYQVGGSTGYSIPGTQLTMMEAPDLNTYSAIEAAAESNELSVQGRFSISDLKYNVDEVVNAINQTAGIEVSEAETIGPAEVSPSDPYNYTPMTGPTPEEISAAESNEAVEYLAENGTYSHTTGNYTQDSSQAGHGVPEYYGSGSAGETRMQYDEMNSEWNDYVGKRVAHEMRGYYRTGVVGDNPPIMAGKNRQTIARMTDAQKRKYYEEGGVKTDKGWTKGANRWQALHVAKGVAANEADRKGLSKKHAESFGPYEPSLDTATPTPPAAEADGSGYETLDSGVYTETMLAEEDGTVVPGTYEVESSQETSLQGWGQGDVVGTIIANYDGTPFGFRAEGDYAGLPGAIDDGFYPNTYGEDSAIASGRGVPQWYGSAEQFEAEGEFTRDDLVRMVDEIRDMIDELDEEDMDDMDDIYQELMQLEEQLESHMEEAYAAESFGLGDYTGALDNGMGEGTAAGSGNGVPQWFGSAETFEALGEPDAEYDQGYNDQLDESLGMRHRGQHSQSLKDRRDESKGMEKAMGNRAYSDVGTMDVMEAQGTGVINMTNGAILVGATVVGALVANFFSKKGETEVSEEAGSVKEDKGNGQ